MSARRIGGLLIASMVVSVAGCGGDDGSSETATPAATGFAPAAAAAAEEQRQGLVDAQQVGQAASAGRSDRDSLRGNAPPAVTQVEIVRPEADDRNASGVELWQVVADGSDPDGDSIRFSYRWIVNGDRTDEDDEFFPAGRLVRGDRLQVEVEADDGHATSVPLSSGTITIGNSAPRIVSRPPRLDALGRFRYPIRVEDPDGDSTFSYELEHGPDGMKIDATTGVVSWQPSVDQAGSHEIAVAVRDEAGAQATQSFRLALVKRVEESPPAAAR